MKSNSETTKDYSSSGIPAAPLADVSSSASRKTRADCTVRALAAVAGIDYALAESIALEAGRGLGRSFKSARLIDTAKQMGYSFRKIRMGSRSLRKFLREHPAGRYYARKRGHAFSIVDGAPSDHTPLGAIVLDAWEFVSTHGAITAGAESQHTAAQIEPSSLASGGAP